MPKVYIDETPVVQTVGAGGIGVFPPPPARVAEEISEAGRSLKEVMPPINKLPNPAMVEDNSVIQEADDVWQAGSGGDIEPNSGSGGSGSSSGSGSSGDVPVGSGLPAYTAENIGSVLTISQAKTVQNFTLIPEQTVEVSLSGDPPGGIFQIAENPYPNWTVSDIRSISVTVDGTTYDADLYMDGGDFVIEVELSQGRTLYLSGGIMLAPDDGVYTISAVATIDVPQTVTTGIHTLVQEQTVTTVNDNDSGLAFGSFAAGTYDFSSVHEGDLVTVTVNDVVYQNRHVSDDGNGELGFMISDSMYVFWSPDGEFAALGTIEPGDYTISATYEEKTPVVAPVWVPNNSGILVVEPFKDAEDDHTYLNATVDDITNAGIVFLKRKFGSSTTISFLTKLDSYEMGYRLVFIESDNFGGVEECEFRAESTSAYPVLYEEHDDGYDVQ